MSQRKKESSTSGSINEYSKIVSGAKKALDNVISKFGLDKRHRIQNKLLDNVPTFFDSTKEGTEGIFDIRDKDVESFLKKYFEYGMSLAGELNALGKAYSTRYLSNLNNFIDLLKVNKGEVKGLPSLNQLKDDADSYIRKEAPEASSRVTKKLTDDVQKALIKMLFDGIQKGRKESNASKKLAYLQEYLSNKFTPAVNRLIQTIRSEIDKGVDVSSEEEVQLKVPFEKLEVANKSLYEMSNYLDAIEAEKEPDVDVTKARELIISLSGEVNKLLKEREVRRAKREEEAERQKHNDQLELIKAKADVSKELATHNAKLKQDMKPEEDVQKEKEEVIKQIAKAFNTIKSFSKNKDKPEDYSPSEVKDLATHLENIETLVDQNRDFLSNYFKATVGQELGASNMVLSLDDFENRLRVEKEKLTRIVAANKILDSLKDYKKEYSDINKWINAKTRRSQGNVAQKVKETANLKRKLTITGKKAKEYSLTGEDSVYQQVNELATKVGLLNKKLDKIIKITSKKESMISKLVKSSKLAESLNDPMAMQPQDIPPPEEQTISDPQILDAPMPPEPAAPAQIDPVAQPIPEQPASTVSVETTTEPQDNSSSEMSTRKIMTAVKKAVNGELTQMAKNLTHAIKWPEDAAKKAIKITTDKSAKDILTKVKNNLKEDMNEKLSSIIEECVILEKKLAKTKAKAKEKAKDKKAKVAKKDKAKDKPKAKKTKKESLEMQGSMSKFFAASKVVLEAKNKKDVGKYLFKNRPSKKSKK